MNTLLNSLYLIAIMLFTSTTQAGPAANFRVVLTGDQEVPPVETETSGTALLHVNGDWSSIRFELKIEDGAGILGAAGSHLHCAPAGANGTVVVFLAGMSPPGFDGDVLIRGTLTDASIIDDACGATIAELVNSIYDGDVYINVHSKANPGGEIRGQIQ